MGVRIKSSIKSSIDDSSYRFFGLAAPHRCLVSFSALCVEKAHIREATVSGWFEVADAENPFTYENGALTVQVKCHWYGLRPKTEKDWMHLRITNKYQLVRRFSGDVVDNVEEA